MQFSLRDDAITQYTNIAIELFEDLQSETRIFFTGISNIANRTGYDRLQHLVYRLLTDLQMKGFISWIIGSIVTPPCCLYENHNSKVRVMMLPIILLCRKLYTRSTGSKVSTHAAKARFLLALERARKLYRKMGRVHLSGLELRTIKGMRKSFQIQMVLRIVTVIHAAAFAGINTFM